MKPRRVMLMIELETDTPLAKIREAKSMLLRDKDFGLILSQTYTLVEQIQANVIKSKAKKRS